MSRLGWIDAPRASLTQWDDLTRFADALVVLDSTDPAAVLAIERAGIGNTLFVISSKSGTTVETLAFYHYFVARARPGQFVAITDPGSPLETLGRLVPHVGVRDVGAGRAPRSKRFRSTRRGGGEGAGAPSWRRDPSGRSMLRPDRPRLEDVSALASL